MKRFLLAAAFSPLAFFQGYSGGGSSFIGGITAGPGTSTFTGIVDINNHVIVRDDNILQLGGTTPSALYGGLSLRTADVPDTNALYTGTTSNAWTVREFDDLGFNFAHAVATDPSIFIHSHNQSTTQFLGLYHNATDAVVSTGAGSLNLAPANGAVWISRPKTLTESSATSFVQISVASGTATGGTITYEVEANDSTDFQSRSGILPFSVVNKGGTETCTVGTVTTATEVVALSSAATLANTFTCDTSPTNGVNIQANAVSSLTQTTLRINYSVHLTGFATNTVTPQ